MGLFHCYVSLPEGIYSPESKECPKNWCLEDDPASFRSMALHRVKGPFVKGKALVDL